MLINYSVLLENMGFYLKLKPLALGYLIVALFIFLLGNFVVQKNKKLILLKNKKSEGKKNEMEEHVSVSKELLWAFFLLLLTRSCRVVYPLVIELDCRISFLILLLAIVNFCFKLLLFYQPLFFLWIDGFLLKPKSFFWACLSIILRVEGFFFKGLFLSKRSLRVFSFLLKKSFYKGFFYCLILFGRVGLGAFSSGFLMGFCLIYYIIFWDFCLVTDYACMIQMAQASYEANLMFYNTVLLDNKASPDTLKSVEKGMGSCIFLFEALLSELMRLHDDFFFRWYKQIAKRFGFYFVTNDFHDIQKQELNRVTAARLALVEDLKRVECSKSKSFFKRLFAK